VFVPGEDEFKAGRSDGYDFGFLHIKVINLQLLFLLSAFTFQQFASYLSQNPILYMGSLVPSFCCNAEIKKC